MDQVVGRPATDARPKGTLRGIARTGVLLMAAAVASAFLVNPPSPAHDVQAVQGASYVPASGQWIERGKTPGSRPSPVAEMLNEAVGADPATATAQGGNRR